jgi:hypothetical protein
MASSQTQCNVKWVHFSSRARVPKEWTYEFILNNKGKEDFRGTHFVLLKAVTAAGGNPDLASNAAAPSIVSSIAALLWPGRTPSVAEV